MSGGSGHPRSGSGHAPSGSARAGTGPGGGPYVTGLRAAVYTVPTESPEADGTLSWSDTTLVVVHVRSEGATGLGWTYGSPAA
ncbi:MAG TPA: hypothetical protein VHF26_14745, partial [Trebonia sp.]|nr:hypothetical protein [Trebonia sp.]